jgi:hypothetical protein
MADLEKGVKVDKRLGFYDWANSVYTLPIASAVFPIFMRHCFLGRSLH